MPGFFLMYNRIAITQRAAALVAVLQQQYGALMFHQSGGCCDGSQPMCFEVGEFRVGANDVCLGTIEGCEFWMSGDQFEYWQHTHLTMDVVEGRGSSFSLEIPMGFRFIVQSRLFTPAEAADLAPIRCGV